MAFRKSGEGGGYLLWVVGGLLGLALLVILSYSFSPLEGCVGVVEIKNEIVVDDIPSSLLSGGIYGSESIAKSIESADKRPDVRALLVVIDSPGGSVVGSRQIYDALRSLNKSSVAYLQELAASGGYMVASGTDTIVSNPDALTGNIGARMTFLEYRGLFEKLGVNETAIKSGAMKDMGTPAREMTPGERMVFESIVNESFEEFKGAVVEGRGSRLNMGLFEEALDARVMTGRQAQKIGLVDKLGGKKAALLEAARLGGMESGEPKVCDLSPSNGRRGLLGSLSSDVLLVFSRTIGLPRLSYS